MLIFNFKYIYIYLIFYLPVLRDVCPSGGVETFSDVPIRYSREVRKRLLQFPKVSKKGTMAILGLTKGLKLKDLAPEAPAIANYTTGEVRHIYSLY
jgi:acetyl-CoA acyltransferase